VDRLDLFSSTSAAPTDEAWTVVQVTTRGKRLIEAGFDRLWVQGEVTGFKSYRSGHWYFALRDRHAQVRCVMWRTDTQTVSAPPEEGAQVFVEAQPTLWEERGEFRLTVRQLIATEAGGLWQQRLEQAKAALQRDGLLDPQRKRRLPPYPTRIAIVTSPDGAALRDIVSVARRRWPGILMYLVPARVQGETAETELVRALRTVSRLPVDLVIVGRGGGSREDLWAFNSEAVARAVAAVPVPTISAVGHETDISLTDLVADVRAATPTAAAEAALPDRDECVAQLAGLARGLAIGLMTRLDVAVQRLERTGDRMHAAVTGKIAVDGARLDTLATALDAMSPLKVLGRGYAMARDRAGTVLKRVDQFAPHRAFRLTVSDGDVNARVERPDR